MRTEPFSAAHDQLRETVRRFVASEITPHVQEWEAAGGFPDKIVRRAGELGLLGLTVDPAYGGQGPAERWLRDTRLGPIGGGTDEIMREIIGRSMGF